MAGKIIHKSPMKSRQVGSPHNLRKTFMIYTEGQTEEGYFKKFKARCKTITGGNALGIVEEAIVQKSNSKKHVDEYWVVFDKDDTSKSDFFESDKISS